MGRRSDHSRAEIREMAVRAATTLVTHCGLEALTVRTIAKHMGYTVGTLYLVFDGLDELICAVNERTLAELAGQMQSRAAVAAPERRVQALVDAYLDYAASEPQRFRLAFEHRPSGGTSEPQALRTARQQIVRLLADGMSDDAPERNIEAAATLWGAVHGLCSLSLAGQLDDSAPVAERARSLTEAWLAARDVDSRAASGRRSAATTRRRGAAL